MWLSWRGVGVVARVCSSSPMDWANRITMLALCVLMV
jgi:hypothetical protein